MKEINVSNPEITINGLEFLQDHDLYEIQFSNFVGSFSSVMNYLYKMAVVVEKEFNDTHGYEIIGEYASVGSLRKNGLKVPNEAVAIDQVVRMNVFNYDEAYVIEVDELKGIVSEMYHLIESYTN
ncbi:hypothetical protein FJQ98_16565 [Lysinibacillus agricola]|uniref:Uncharacterized protein n=1 Tax=Lysinibacillus agricola TaxID=2590012 RepID=A0ABX7AMC0_9BACI|nr:MULTISPECIES: hypothetical protein [Lysinibacillus]KOS61458.1 hypothetical protein AN161_17865 [Lysinibacillus sp. FJAT-14222]QQP10859.1 hypothetical protein FJQ98_16565 [Lysinibacillus agricola]